MSFDKHSNFNKLANFSEVKFGENMPVLEVELNEMQQIQNEARADIIRDTMPSGFVTLGEIDYDHCASKDNQLKLKTESIAYVNGYRITIPANTIIEIGESDKVREDLVFLEVWKEAVTDNSELKEYGGEDNEVINNPIKDGRYPVATSQRVQLKYRIRVHKNAPFDNQYLIDGLGLKMASNPPSNYPLCTYGCGSNNNTYESINNNDLRYIAMFRKTSVRDYVWQDTGLDDEGLFVAGATHKAFESVVGSIDGLSYAIPMFRLLRKPNVGLASPFEYKKIHNQLDPKKFAHLVGQENVEKVHSVEIAGRTYNNHTLNTKDMSLRGTGSFMGFHLQHSEVSKPLKTDTDYLFIINVKSNTLVGDYDYSLDFGETDPPNSRQQSCFTSQFSLPLNALGFSTHILHTKNSFDGVYCVSRSQLSNSVKSGNIVFDYMIIEYSPELVDIDFIPYFEGVKSLGELTNNSITVENNLVEEGTYVHELQNHILPTHPEVTHVTWGEDVVIPPEVEIELKNGEEVVQTITQLPVKLETTGKEKLHVKTMKGRTLVNLATSPQRTVTATGSWQPLSPISLVSGKKYLAIFHVESNTLDSVIKDVFKSDDDVDTVWGGNIVPAGGVGTFKKTFVAPFDTKNYNIYSDTSSQGSATVKCVLLEYLEDMENWGLKYFEGMKSVEAPNIKVTGKNLFDVNLHSSITIREDGIYELNTSDWSRSDVPYLLKPNTTYTLSFHTDHSHCWTCIKINGNTTSLKINENYSKSFTTDSTGIVNLGVYANAKDNVGITFISIQLEENNFNTAHTPHKLHTFRTPKDIELRSLPNDIFDCLDLSTGLHTQRVGLVSFEGSSDDIWISNTDFDTESTKFFFTHNGILRSGIKKIHPSSSHYVLNDYFISANSDHRDVIKNKKIEGVLGGDGHDGMIQFFIRRDRLSSLNDIGFNQWLSNNPVHVQYVLAQPTTKKIGLSEDDYVGKSKVTYQLAEPLRRVGNYSDYIQGNTLYSNIGVEVLDGSENWEVQNNTGNNHGFFLPHTKSIYKSPLISPQLPTLDGWEDYTRKGIFRGTEAIGLVVSADDLSENTLQGFKNWLRDNPVTIYYVKSNPSEIPLKEVSPLECDFSLYRQFKRGYENCLKELPNGVKDVIENGKVKRNVELVSLGDFAPDKWHVEFSSENYIAFDLRGLGFQNNNPYTSNYRFSNVLPFITHAQYAQANTEGLRFSSIPALVVSKSRLTTPDTSGLVTWLRNNNVSMLYQLNSPTTEELTEENSRYVPYMPLNSYVGSLYLTNGINQTKFLTDFSPSEYEVQTYHRHFSSDFNMFEDTTLKKSPYGHETYLEEIDGKYVEKFIAGLEKHEIEDLRHKVSLTGFDYSQLLQDSFLKLIKGELS